MVLFSRLKRRKSGVIVFENHRLPVFLGNARYPREVLIRFGDRNDRLCINGHREHLLCLLYLYIGKNQPIIYTLFGVRNQPQNVVIPSLRLALSARP